MSLIILFVVWFQVQLDVMINNWFGTFYDMIQRALSAPNSVTRRSLLVLAALIQPVPRPPAGAPKPAASPTSPRRR